MSWNGGVTNSTVDSNAEAHGPKEMDRLNKYHNDVDLEADPNDGSISTIRTKTRFRDGKLQFIDADGHILTVVVPNFSNNQSVTLPDDTGTMALSSGGGTPIETIQNVGAGVGVFKQKVSSTVDLYTLQALSNKIDLALNAGSNLIELDVDETALTLDNLGGTLGIAKGGTGQTTANAAFGALSPMTTNGDIITRSGGNPSRLAIGSEGEVLTVVSGAPAWAAAGGGGGGGAPGNGESATGQWGKISAGSGFGVLAGYFKPVIAGSGTLTGYRTASEHGMVSSASASNDGAGLVAEIANLYRELEFTLTVRWQAIKNASDSTNIWMGVTSDLTAANFTSSTYANNINCLLFGKKDGDSTWRTIRNNGGASPTTSDTKTEDENIHKVVITGGASNMTLKHDSDATSTYTTVIPSTTQPLGIILWQNAESSTAKALRILDVNLDFTWKTGG